MKLLRPWLLWAAGCGSVSGPPAAGAPEPHTLSEAQGLVTVREALVSAGALARGALPLRLDGRAFDADVHFGVPAFAIEWVSPDDRAAFADLPRGGAESPLQIVTAEAREAPVQVLILDAAAYGYEGNSLLVQRGAPGIEDAERRVRRDVADFLEYVRDQGGRL